MSALTTKGTPTIRVAQQQPALSDGSDTVEFDNYDDQDFGYLGVTDGNRFLTGRPLGPARLASSNQCDCYYRRSRGRQGV